MDNESAADNVGVRGAVRRLRRGRNTQESRQSRDAQGAYYFRDQQGLEVDFLVPRPNAGLWLVEAKATQTVRPAMASSLLSLGRSLTKRSARLVVVHRKSRSELATAALTPGVEALDVERFVVELNRAK
jgi:predicted AAA+ superfamily ATPase